MLVGLVAAFFGGRALGGQFSGDDEIAADGTVAVAPADGSDAPASPTASTSAAADSAGSTSDQGTDGDPSTASADAGTQEADDEDTGAGSETDEPGGDSGQAGEQGSDQASDTGDGGQADEADTDGGDPAPPTTLQVAEVITSVPPTAENPSGAVRYAIYRNGTATLRGLVRDQEAVDRIVTSFEAVFGAGNVVQDYQISPAAPRWTDAPIYFEDVVLFDLDSSEVRPEFLPLLEQTAGLLDQGPFVSITVVASTDASGSVAYNQRLATERAQAVVDYYVDELDVEEFRVGADVLGEREADPDADEAAAAAERRVELVVRGIRG
jgi:outer membrane protein OmpA-like peptidoglycan-associated protein